MRRLEPAILSNRRVVVTTLTYLYILCALLLAFLFRFDFTIPEVYHQVIFHLVVPLLVIKLLVFRFMGVSRGWWRFVSMGDVFDIFKANLVASAFLALWVSVTIRLENFPRSILILDGIFCFLFACGIRFVTRAIREEYFSFLSQVAADRQNVLIYGAGMAGQSIAKEIRQNPSMNLNVVGFVDDDQDKQGNKFIGYPVLGMGSDLGPICRDLDLEEVIIAIPSATGKQIKKIVDKLQRMDLKARILPGISSLIDGKVSIQQLRDIDLEDLLGRDPVSLDMQEISGYLQDRRVLVSGAAGSIGSELCRQIAKFHPSHLILLDHAESPLFYIENEIAKTYPELKETAVMASIRDMPRIQDVFRELEPEVVFHAAAYKHVPMMEHNPAEAIQNNVRGTNNLALAADAAGVEKFVMISTDKAVNPTNVMGASKRAAETCVQALAQASKTAFTTVRFGNVLGSNGSVIPTFREQIRDGGPVTVTHKDITRFFMSIPEAAQLVLEAGAIGGTGEIMLLDMGEPVRIVELAEQLIRLSGYEPYEDIDITFSGLRPGEKLYEELLLAGEGVKRTRHEKICTADAMIPDPQVLSDQLKDLYENARLLNAKKIVRCLKQIVPEFTPGRYFDDDEVKEDDLWIEGGYFKFHGFNNPKMKGMQAELKR